MTATTEFRAAAEARKAEVRAYCDAQLDKLLAAADPAKAADCRTRFAAALDGVMDRQAWSTLVKETVDHDFFLLAMDDYRAALRS